MQVVKLGYRKSLIIRSHSPTRKVSATAIEDSRVLIWHRDKLKLSINSDPFLVSVFDHILGRDVVKKLMQVRFFLSFINSPVGNIDLIIDFCIV